MAGSTQLAIILILLLLKYETSGGLALLSRPFKIEKSKLSHVNESVTTTTISTTSATSISTTASTTLATSTTHLPTTSTAAPTSTAPPTLKPNVTNSTSTQPPSSSSGNLKRLTRDFFCECDLRIHICDINCCCDVDCTKEMLKAFTCADRMQTMHTASTHQQGLPLCKTNEGWLCIFKDNSRKQVVEVYDADRKVETKYKWPNYFPDEDEVEHDREYYVSGDQILIYNEQTEEIKTLDLPYSLLSSYCHISEPVRHLEDVSRKCMMTVDDSQTFFNTFIQDIGSVKLLRNRSEVVAKKPQIERSHYIDFNVSLCKSDEHFAQCQRMRNDSVIANDACWKLDILLYHNFTNLTAIDVFLTCDESDQDLKSFNVKFIQHNESRSTTATNVSGKYGYRIGFPVITGKYVDVSEAVAENERRHVINYFHANETVRNLNTRIALPKSVAGICSNEFDDVVNFHENSLTQCMMTISNSSILTAKTNYTNFCASLQTLAFHYLANDENFTGTFQMYVSELGWPLNDSSRWVHVEAKNFDARQTIGGSFSPETNSFRCLNMILSARYEFTIARISVAGVHRQNAIKKAAVEFGNRVDLHFKLDEDLTLPLYTYVMFYDATANGSAGGLTRTFIALNTFLASFIVVFYLKYIVQTF